MKIIIALAGLVAPAVALAQGTAPAADLAAQAVKLTSETFVAKSVTDEKGVKSNKLFPATRVLPGDPLVFQLTYNNQGVKPATRFVINNPIPSGVAYTGVREASATVSVDGGKTFGALATLKVKGADGKLRGAIPADVTQIRWTFAQPIAPKAKGTVMFYGLVK
jgi:uncharacterized repeat protein (TIGR01451 family)